MAADSLWTYTRRILFGLLWLYGFFGLAPTVGYFIGWDWWPALVCFSPLALGLGWLAYQAGEAMESS